MRRYADMLCLLCTQQQQPWMQPQSSMYAAQSASHSGSWSQQQPPHQQLQHQQLSSQQIAKAELQALVLQLTSQQREHLSKMPHDKRMQFFHNLRNQMARAQQQQQLQQQQQQMGQQGSWQQPPGLQQAGAGPMQQPGLSSQPQVCSGADDTSILCNTEKRNLAACIFNTVRQAALLLIIPLTFCHFTYMHIKYCCKTDTMTPIHNAYAF